ncbi:hypothetical protein DEU56DRAFT_340945 [Suillus clintonianus]|uniref:uncharacterized protein n=1 Tax=Suillus clintonianus TaxID=1904413 RepID=UPI001B8621D8|nr:uncharacterized protein DEU56DRAFT_340945 [Suillus clintonianus]KAG2138334.1 hypothetical protein DEU56DRAFT_340945 [Suillus clintonianus]
MLNVSTQLTSAGIVNIRHDVDDSCTATACHSFSPKSRAKAMNGIKTAVSNMADVSPSRAQCRLPTYPTKFFGRELGAQTSFASETERYIAPFASGSCLRKNHRVASYTKHSQSQMACR